MQTMEKVQNFPFPTLTKFYFGLQLESRELKHTLYMIMKQRG